MSKKVELKLPEGATKLDYRKAGMIRELFLRYRHQTLAVRGGTPGNTHVSKRYDFPEGKKPCIWYQIYEHGVQRGYCPLWAVDYHMYQGLAYQTLIQPTSIAKDDLVNRYFDHGLQLAKDAASLLKSTAHQLAELVPMRCQVYNYTPETAMEMLKGVNRLDPVLELLYRDYADLKVKSDLKVEALLTYARHPGVYQGFGMPVSKFESLGFVDVYGVENATGIPAPAVDGVFNSL